MTPLLSICVPTHGRRAPLMRAPVQSVLDQVDEHTAGQIEICISDNASVDDTPQVIAALRAGTTVPIVSGRNATDLGFAGNLLRVVELAYGTWCWLVGSDDEVTDDGLAHILSLLRRFPDVSGHCVNWANFDSTLTARGERDGTADRPPRLQTRVYQGFHEVMSEVGLTCGYISANVVRRDRWLAAADVLRGDVEPTWALVQVIWEMARRDPAWTYAPHAVLRNRTSNGWMYHLGVAPVLSSTGPHPVHLGYRWFDADGRTVVLDGLRGSLPGPLAPGGQVQVRVGLLTPWDEGDYVLRVSLVQEGVAWLDDVEAANGRRVRVAVRHPL